MGAGPVGSHLAKEFALRDYRVLVLEKGEVGRPLKGTGHVSVDIFDHVPKDDDFVEKEIRGGVFHNRFGSYSFRRDEVTSYVLDRPKFDRSLFQRAKESGVEEVREGFVNCKHKRGKVIVETEEGTYETKILAGCDGPTSDVRVSAEFEKPGLFLHGIFTKQIEVGPIEQDYVEVFLDASKDFFGWKVPRTESFEYGLAVELGGDSRKALEEFADEENFHIADIHSGLIPILPPEKTTKGRVFLCGDAAGQVKPFSGGGLIYGLTAAEIAAEKIDPDDATTLSKYEAKWREELGDEIKFGNRIRKFYKLPFFLRAPFLWAGKRMSKNAHMDRPSTLLR